jgi:predicted RecA/RadA family phage recombinase
MAQTYQARRIAGGTRFDHTPGSAVGAGAVVVQNSLVGIAENDIAANALGALAVNGTFDLVKINGAMSAGDPLYWDSDGDPQGGTAGSGAATTTSTDNDFIGFAVADAADTDEKVRMLLVHPSSITVYNQLTNAIADPGDAGAISVTLGGYCPLVTAGAETRTLAAPSFIGQELLLYLKTDGGNCVVTCATTINETGNNTITFANTGEAVRLTAVEEGANLRWRLATADGATLSTV